MTLIFKSLVSGFQRSLKVWKAVLIIWLFSFIIVSVYVSQAKNTTFAVFGNSMITNELYDNFNPAVFFEPGTGLRDAIISGFKGFPLLFLVFFVSNAFFTAGLFCKLRKKTEIFSISEFFRSGAEKFWPYLGITLIISILLILLFITCVFLTLMVASFADISSGKTVFILIVSSLMLFFLLMPVMILVSDYSRAWQAAASEKTPCKAVIFGFKTVFDKFGSSYFIMIILVLVQVIFTVAVVYITMHFRPSTGAGVFLLFLLAQGMVIIRLIIKTWRYASITALMEIFAENERYVS